MFNNCRMLGNMAEANLAEVRETTGAGLLLMVDAGSGHPFWQNGYQRARRTALFIL
jgi:hypothetical protein